VRNVLYVWQSLLGISVILGGGIVPLACTSLLDLGDGWQLQIYGIVWVMGG
jgi:hypothetical protein